MSAFVAERAGWFDPVDLGDALPGVEAPNGTLPADRADKAAPVPETRPPETAVVRPERKPAPDAVAPARKPDVEGEPATRTAESTATADPDTDLDARDTPSATADLEAGGGASDGGTSDGGASDDGDASVAGDREQRADGGSGDDRAQPSNDAKRGSDETASETATVEPADTTEPTDTPNPTQASEPAAETDQTADRAEASAPRAEPESDGAAVRDPDSGMQLTVPARDDNGEAPAGASVAQVPAPEVPSFDIVRVERSGEAVIAGRAAPRSRVTVLQGDQPIATAEADDRGEFVAIPHRPLPPGQRQLTLRAEDPETGETAQSDRAVVIDIPRMPDDDTPEAAETTRTAEREQERGEGGAQVAARSSEESSPEAPPTQSDQRERAAPASASTGEPASEPATAARDDEARTREQTQEAVAVRDNVPAADPPLLTEPSDNTDAREGDGNPPATRAGGGPQTAGEPLTVPAPPEAGGDGDAPAATVTDVPEPPGTGPDVTTRTAQAAPDEGPQVTARRDGDAARDGADRTATRAMRPLAAAPADGADSADKGVDTDGSLEADAGMEATGGGETGGSAASSGGAGDTGGAPIAVLVPREGTGEVEVLQRPSGETGLADRQLVLEAVQYTVDGGISISGQAPAEAMVVAFLNETELARVRTPADGDWTMAPDADVPPGLHTLRVDQLGPDGAVEASVSTPFANQPMVDDLDEDEGMVVIQPGDNLWTIARRTYGQGWEYTLIYRANRDQIRDPDLIYPGQVFVVPEEQRRDADGAN